MMCSRNSCRAQHATAQQTESTRRGGGPRTAGPGVPAVPRRGEGTTSEPSPPRLPGSGSAVLLVLVRILVVGNVGDAIASCRRATVLDARRFISVPTTIAILVWIPGQDLEGAGVGVVAVIRWRGQVIAQDALLAGQRILEIRRIDAPTELESRARVPILVRIAVPHPGTALVQGEIRIHVILLAITVVVLLLPVGRGRFTDLWRAWVRLDVAVAAILVETHVTHGLDAALLHVQRGSIAIPIRVAIPGQRIHGILGVVVAVVVDLRLSRGLTDLDARWIDVEVRVVAVRLIAHIARPGRTAGHHGRGGRPPKTITVQVREPGHRAQPLVDGPITVVVQAVTQLRGARLHGVIAVVAVRVTGHIAGRSRAREDSEGGVAGAHAITIRVRIPLALHPLIHDSIAIVVLAITVLGRTRLRGGTRIIAILVAGHVSKLRCSLHREDQNNKTLNH